MTLEGTHLCARLDLVRSTQHSFARTHTSSNIMRTSFAFAYTYRFGYRTGGQGDSRAP